ncbi:ABC transporter ATP-binding protein [Dermatobacter hominis]|uniref:ABC transporter ATP-binding protein n=1 Tax=Dermatobacter hominis TaxID=2884263 RepID=UPI001D12D41E|nr:ABC transporter ATP-binding protein [Dermatobacter hominis]UDY35239.1 ABC transporter ATP-binding protein [Dermatobacter hominis]
MEPIQGEPVLRAHGLRKRFDDTQAVDGVSITLHRGERVGIVGPNGAGKTTTLLMLLGAIEPDEGAIDLVGHRLPGDRSAAMQHVGFAAGYLPLPEGLTVAETLALFGTLYGVADPAARAAEVLDELHITRLADQRVESLSSGQGTLVGFAKAVIHHPRLIVLDEPTASLDPDVAMRVRDRLEHMNAEHDSTLLLTSHDMREVAELTTRVIFLRHGRVIADGPPAQVVADAGYRDLEAMFLAEATRLREQEV